MSQLKFELGEGTKLPAAQKLIEYRVLRLGIKYLEQDRNEGFGTDLYRIGEVELLVRMTYVANGQIYWTGVVTNRKKERIDKDPLYYYEMDELFYYYKDMPNMKKADERPAEPVM